jgi:hypothetical protein
MTVMGQLYFTLTLLIARGNFSQKLVAVRTLHHTFIRDVYNHHHHHVAIKELGHLLTRSGLTRPEVS